jgi:hypothetical protein
MDMTKAVAKLRKAGKEIAKSQKNLHFTYVGVHDCFRIKKTNTWEVVLGVTFISGKRV